MENMQMAFSTCVSTCVVMGLFLNVPVCSVSAWPTKIYGCQVIIQGGYRQDMKWNKEAQECQVRDGMEKKQQQNNSITCSNSIISYKISGTNKFNLLPQLYLGVNCTRLNYEDPPSTNVANAATEALRAIQGQEKSKMRMSNKVSCIPINFEVINFPWI